MDGVSSPLVRRMWMVPSTDPWGPPREGATGANPKTLTLNPNPNPGLASVSLTHAYWFRLTTGVLSCPFSWSFLYFLFFSWEGESS